MRRFFFTARIAGLFALVMGAVLVATFLLFGQVAGHGILGELGRLRAHDGVLIAEEIEKLLPAHTLDSPEIRAIVDANSLPWGIDVAIHKRAQLPAVPEVKHQKFRRRPKSLDVEIRGRRCRIFGPPAFETWVPLDDGGKQIGALCLRGPLHPQESHTEFLIGVLQIGFVALAGVVGLSVLLTAPLRRLSKSMDRIANGDFDYRVPERGRDEVAAMAASFNSMAVRIGDMIRGQKELLAAVSHELRSPLARMKISLELLRSRGEEARIEDIESEIDIIDGLIEELLIVSRLDLGSATLKPETVDIEEAVTQAWSRISHDALRLGMELQITIGDGAMHLYADRRLLVRALGNLFENSVRYTHVGTIEVSASIDIDAIKITVADRGPGVDPNTIDQLFEPFYRGDAARPHREAATGLGLMIVRRVVEAHNGTAQAENRTGGGLVISLIFPSDTPR